MHIFKYSRRAGTRADKMPDQVPEPVKAARSDQLLALEKEMSLQYRKSLLGRRKQVLLEEKITVDGRDYMVGHTKEYVKIAVPYEDNRKNTFAEGIVEGMLTEEILLFGKITLAEMDKVV